MCGTPHSLDLAVSVFTERNNTSEIKVFGKAYYYMIRNTNCNKCPTFSQALPTLHCFLFSAIYNVIIHTIFLPVLIRCFDSGFTFPSIEHLYTCSSGPAWCYQCVTSSVETVPAYIPAHCLAHYRTPVLCPGRATTKLYTQVAPEDGMQGGFKVMAPIFFGYKGNSCLVQTIYKSNVLDEAWLFQVRL